MLKLRKKLGEYQEIYYMIFLLAMTGMTSAGINSEHGIYKIVFAAATVFLLLKMAVTDFALRELILMALLTILLGANLLRNGDKTLNLRGKECVSGKSVKVCLLAEGGLDSRNTGAGCSRRDREYSHAPA